MPIRPDWLALTSEAPLEPEREIVDAHHHLWDRYEGTYLLPDYRTDLSSGHRIAATVYVQCRSMYRASGPERFRPRGEVEFANGVAAMAASGGYGPTLVADGIVGCADMTLGERVGEVLDALIAAAPDRLRGVRFPTAFHADPAVASTPFPPERDWLEDELFLTAAAVVASRGLSLDIWAYHTQLGAVRRLSEALPDLLLVLDHCGGPIGVGPYVGRRDAADAEWLEAMTLLARCANVHVKLGGLAMRVGGFALNAAAAPASSAQLARLWALYIGRCVDLFGADRCMFESNFPVDKGMVGYRLLWNAFKRIAAGRSEQEKAALFAGTARRVYRLT